MEDKNKKVLSTPKTKRLNLKNNDTPHSSRTPKTATKENNKIKENKPSASENEDGHTRKKVLPEVTKGLKYKTPMSIRNGKNKGKLLVSSCLPNSTPSPKRNLERKNAFKMQDGQKKLCGTHNSKNEYVATDKKNSVKPTKTLSSTEATAKDASAEFLFLPNTVTTELETRNIIAETCNPELMQQINEGRDVNLQNNNNYNIFSGSAQLPREEESKNKILIEEANIKTDIINTFEFSPTSEKEIGNNIEGDAVITGSTLFSDDSSSMGNSRTNQYEFDKEKITIEDKADIINNLEFSPSKEKVTGNNIEEDPVMISGTSFSDSSSLGNCGPNEDEYEKEKITKEDYKKTNIKNFEFSPPKEKDVGNNIERDLVSGSSFQSSNEEEFENEIMTVKKDVRPDLNNFEISPIKEKEIEDIVMNKNVAVKQINSELKTNSSKLLCNEVFQENEKAETTEEKRNLDFSKENLLFEKTDNIFPLRKSDEELEETKNLKAVNKEEQSNSIIYDNKLRNNDSNIKHFAEETDKMYQFEVNSLNSNKCVLSAENKAKFNTNYETLNKASTSATILAAKEIRKENSYAKNQTKKSRILHETQQRFSCYSYNSPPVLIHNSRGSGDQMNEVLIYKLGSHSTPRKMRKEDQTPRTSKRTWGTPETSYFPSRNHSYNIIAKRQVNKSIINKSRIEKIPSALIKPVNIKSSDVIKLNRKIATKTLTPNKVNSCKKVNRNLTTEVYEIKPVRSLVNKFESIISGNKIKQDERQTVKIKIKKHVFEKEENLKTLAPETNLHHNLENHNVLNTVDGTSQKHNYSCKRKFNFEGDDLYDDENVEETQKLLNSVLKKQKTNSELFSRPVTQEMKSDTSVISDGNNESYRNFNQFNSNYTEDSGFSDAKTEISDSFKSVCTSFNSSTNRSLCFSESHNETNDIKQHNSTPSHSLGNDHISSIYSLENDSEISNTSNEFFQHKNSEEMNLDNYNSPKSDKGQFVSNFESHADDTPTASISMLFNVAQSLGESPLSYSEYREEFYKRLGKT